MKQKAILFLILSIILISCEGSEYVLQSYGDNRVILEEENDGRIYRYSPDGKWLISDKSDDYNDDHIKIFNSSDLSFERSIKIPYGYDRWDIKNTAISDDMQYIAAITTRYDDIHFQIFIWDFKSGEYLGYHRCWGRHITSLAFKPNTTDIYFAGRHEKIFIAKKDKYYFRFDTTKSISDGTNYGYSYLSDRLRFSSNGSLLLTNKILDFDGSTFNVLSNDVRGLIYDIYPDNNRFIIYSRDGIDIYDLQNDKLLGAFVLGNDARCHDIQVSNDGKYFAAYVIRDPDFHYEGLTRIGIEVYDAETAKLVDILSFSSNCLHYEFDPTNSNRLLVSTEWKKYIIEIEY